MRGVAGAPRKGSEQAAREPARLAAHIVVALSPADSERAGDARVGVPLFGEPLLELARQRRNQAPHRRQIGGRRARSLDQERRGPPSVLDGGGGAANPEEVQEASELVAEFLRQLCTGKARDFSDSVDTWAGGW